MSNVIPYGLKEPDPDAPSLDELELSKQLTASEENVKNTLNRALLNTAGIETPQVEISHNEYNPLQLAKAVSGYAHASTYYVDFGTANNYIIQPANCTYDIFADQNNTVHHAVNMAVPNILLDGMEVRFRPLHNNTGVSIITIRSHLLVYNSSTNLQESQLVTLTTKNIKLSDGITDVPSNAINTLQDCTLRYSVLYDCFILQSYAIFPAYCSRIYLNSIQTIGNSVFTKVDLNSIAMNDGNTYWSIDTSNHAIRFKKNVRVALNTRVTGLWGGDLPQSIWTYILKNATTFDMSKAILRSGISYYDNGEGADIISILNYDFTINDEITLWCKIMGRGGTQIAGGVAGSAAIYNDTSTFLEVDLKREL